MSEMSTFGDIFAKMKEKYKVDIDVGNIDLASEKVKSYNNIEGDLHKVDGYNCEKCKNKGFIARLGENGEEIHSECSCKKIRSTLRRARKSGLGDIITQYTFKSYKDTQEWQKTIKSKAEAFCADDTAKWFFIGGQVGCGKTHICTAIAAHYIKAGLEVKYMLWSEEAKKLKAFVNDVNYQDMISLYKNIDVLYIDDFLKVKNGEVPTAADINLAFEIINHRLLDKSKITIISSEKTLEDILDYDEATMSRIYQQAGIYKISVAKDRSKNYRLFSS